MIAMFLLISWNTFCSHLNWFLFSFSSYLSYYYHIVLLMSRMEIPLEKNAWCFRNIGTVHKCNKYLTKQCRNAIGIFNQCNSEWFRSCSKFTFCHIKLTCIRISVMLVMNWYISNIANIFLQTISSTLYFNLCFLDS